MDYQKIADSFISPACILSVEKKDDGYGEIRFVAGNKVFADMIREVYVQKNPDLSYMGGGAFFALLSGVVFRFLMQIYKIWARGCKR